MHTHTYTHTYLALLRLEHLRDADLDAEGRVVHHAVDEHAGDLEGGRGREDLADEREGALAERGDEAEKLREIVAHLHDRHVAVDSLVVLLLVHPGAGAGGGC